MASQPSSTVKVTKYELPRGATAVNTAIVGALMVLSTRRSFIQLGSPLYDRLIVKSAKAIKYSTIVQDVIFYFLFGAHSIETVHFALTKLKKYGVKALSLTWFKWILACFIGGINTIKQFDEIVAKRKAQ